jgi:polyisoprenoid-binding protein YceI
MAAESHDTGATVTRILAPGSTHIRFTTTHLMGLGKVAGSVQLVRGSAVLDATGAELVAVEAELDLTSFDTGSRARDQAVASARFLDFASHPRATYSSTAVERLEDGWLVRGTLTAKGVTAAVDLHVAGTDLSGGGPVRATATVDRTAHDITVPIAMAGRHLRVVIEARPNSEHVA